MQNNNNLCYVPPVLSVFVFEIDSYFFSIIRFFKSLTFRGYMSIIIISNDQK